MTGTVVVLLLTIAALTCIFSVGLYRAQKRNRELVQQIKHLETALLSDPVEDTALLNFMEIVSNKGWTITNGGLKYKGDSYRDIIREMKRADDVKRLASNSNITVERV